MKFERKITIDTKSSHSKEIKQFIELKNKKEGIRKYQIEAYENLNTKLLDDDTRVAGMLVLPTGGGKTRVSISWAIDKAVNDGYKVLWIAHRHMLLEQAYETFIKFSGLCTIKNELNLKIVSGKSNHAKIQDIDFKKDDIVVASIGSMHKKLRKKFRSVKKLLVIVDEAHHSVAPTYKEWIGLVDNKNKFGWFRKQFSENKFDKLKILGLTATPINSSEKKEEELKAIYDNQEALFKISTADLMKKGILSQPILNPISTESMVDIDIEDINGSTKEKKKSINRLLANNIKRNHHIVETYQKHYRDGKTLLFAVDKNHSEMLKGMFNERDINSEIIYSGKSYKDGSFDSNDEVIESFKDPKSKLNVLININILTEGSDIPNIQNLFITRVVGSETLYTQMIGRALRGVHSGGTKNANIVTFEDNIKNFDILSLKDLFAENGWAEDDIQEKSFKDIEIKNDRKYSINEIENILEEENIEYTKDDEIKNIYRYNLLDSELLKDERIKDKIDEDKQSNYLIGIRDLRTKTKRWSFTKEQGQFSFKTDKKSDIKNFDKDSKLFYFIIQKQTISTPITGKTLYWQEAYKSFMENHTKSGNITMLPSYGMPVGEYKLYDKKDELLNIIPVFKFQANSYERFLEDYYNNDNAKSLNIEEIKDKYFLETNNFIPISDRILESLCIHIKAHERPILDEYEFEKMNEADDIIDNIARQLSIGEAFNLNNEYNEYKILHGFYTREDFQSEVLSREGIIRGYKNEVDIIKEIPIKKLDLKRFNYVDSDDFNKIHNLDELYKYASKEVCNQLEISKLQHSPKNVQWTKKAFKSYAGIARGIDIYTKTIANDRALLEINSILCSKDIPSYVIEFVLYHEILHFELKAGHTKEFRRYEGLYPKYDEARKILSEISDWVSAYWEDEKPVKRSTNFYVEDKKNTDRYSWKLYEKKIKNIQVRNLKLPSIEKMHELYEDEKFKKDVLKNKKLFLCDDKKTIFNFDDKSSDNTKSIFPTKNGRKGEIFSEDLHLLVMES